MNKTPKAVLFDLDGTLLDTAADLGAALNGMLRDRSRPELPFDVIRPLASHGSRGLLQLGFGDAFNPQTAEALKADFLSRYAANIAQHTRYFPGIEAMLNTLQDRDIRVGIVTNKPTAYTTLLLTYFEQLNALPSIVCGDTLSVAKPHPEPLLHAAKQLRCMPEQCWYVGDAERDIQAGQRANMITVIADWGYIGADDEPELWGAHLRAQAPEELLTLIR